MSCADPDPNLQQKLKSSKQAGNDFLHLNMLNMIIMIVDDDHHFDP